MAPVDDVWHVRPTFWLPGKKFRAMKAAADRVAYDVWHDQGFLATTPGPSIDYRFIAAFLWDFCQKRSRRIAFDRWGYAHLKPLLADAGFRDDQLEGDGAIFEPFGQGYQSMSPALLALEAMLLDKAGGEHGMHPVLSMCAANATVQMDPAGNRKLSKLKSHGRIDGMVALAMAASVAGTWEATPVFDVLSMIG